MFENKLYEGIYYSRFIASWYNAGGGRIRGRITDFRNWLGSLIINGKSIPDDIINEIIYLADNGMLELEENARRFLKTVKLTRTEPAMALLFSQIWHFPL